MSTYTDYESFFRTLERNLPGVFSREEASRQMGGILRAKTLSNLDAAGRGPSRIRIGKKVCYERRSFLQWLKAYAQRQ